MQKRKKKFHDYSILCKYEVLEGAIKRVGCFEAIFLWTYILEMYEQINFTTSDFTYHKVASSRPVYNSILELFGQRSQYISIKFPLHKPSENVLLTETDYCSRLYGSLFSEIEPYFCRLVIK